MINMLYNLSQLGMSKSKICITIMKQLEDQLSRLANDEKTTKSALIEKAVSFWLANKLKSDAKKMASLRFEDLPDEDEWSQIQNETD